MKKRRTTEELLAAAVAEAEWKFRELLGEAMSGRYPDAMELYAYLWRIVDRVQRNEKGNDRPHEL